MVPTWPTQREYTDRLHPEIILFNLKLRGNIYIALKNLKNSFEHSEHKQEADSSTSSKWRQKGEKRSAGNSSPKQKGASNSCAQPASRYLRHDVAIEKWAEQKTSSLGIPVKVSPLEKK